MKLILGVFGLAILLSKAAFAQTNSLEVYPFHHRYTVPEGRNVLPFLSLLGFSSVEAFQREIGLQPDGIVGERTWKALRQRIPKSSVTNSAHIKVMLRLNREGNVEVTIKNDSESELHFHKDIPSDVRSKPQTFSLPIAIRFGGEDKDGRAYRASKMVWAHFQASSLAPNDQVSTVLRVGKLGNGVTLLKANFLILQHRKFVSEIESNELRMTGSFDFDQ